MRRVFIQGKWVDIDTSSHPFRGKEACRFHDCGAPADYIEVSIEPHRPCCAGHAMTLLAGGGKTIELEREDPSLRVLREAQGGAGS